MNDLLFTSSLGAIGIFIFAMTTPFKLLVFLGAVSQIEIDKRFIWDAVVFRQMFEVIDCFDIESNYDLFF